MPFNANLFNGPIPGESLTRPPGAEAHQNPPRHTDLDELLESIWAKFNDPKNGIKLYGLLKAGMPAEAIARTVLFAAFVHGECTVDLALLALPTVIRQIVSVGHLMGVKNIKIKNPDPNQTQFLAKIAEVLDSQAPVTAGEQIENITGGPKKPETLFTGLGV